MIFTFSELSFASVNVVMVHFWTKTMSRFLQFGLKKLQNWHQGQVFQRFYWAGFLSELLNLLSWATYQQNLRKNSAADQIFYQHSSAPPQLKSKKTKKPIFSPVGRTLLSSSDLIDPPRHRLRRS